MDYFIVDAFADEYFKGNPAGVCMTEEAIPEILMQKIAKENNLSETSFAYKAGNRYKLRWFTPGFEINLCGHATLATAYVICNFMEPECESVEFETLSGVIEVKKCGESYEMSLPSFPPEKINAASEIIDALGLEPEEIYSERDLYIVLESEDEVKSFVPDYEKLKHLNDWLGVVVTAKGEDVDFVSRYFCLELSLEDPVTGSSHSSLVPLWRYKLQKETFVAKQLSERGGTLYCKSKTDCVKIRGCAKLYLRGKILYGDKKD